MLEDLLSHGGVVVKVLDDEGIVQIDDHWKIRAVSKELVRHMTLNDSHVMPGCFAGNGCGRNDIGPGTGHLASVRRQHRDLVSHSCESPRKLEEPDSDSSRMLMAQRFRADQKDLTHRAPSASRRACGASRFATGKSGSTDR